MKYKIFLKIENKNHNKVQCGCENTKIYVHKMVHINILKLKTLNSVKCP